MRLLLVQTGDIGDLVVTTPAIHALRERYPDAQLILLTSKHAAPVVIDTGLVDEIVTLETGSTTAFFKPANLRRLFGIGRCDGVIYFRQFTLLSGTIKFALMALAVRAPRRIGLQNGNGWFLTESLPDSGFGAKHQGQYWLDLVGLLDADTSPRPARVAITRGDTPLLPLTDDDNPLIVIHPGSGGYSLARRWDATSFANVADALHEQHNAQVIIVGASGDDTAAVIAAMQHDPIDLTGQTTLPQLADVIQQADLFIGADSGVMHIAAATGTPVIAIFGPSNHAAWHPWTDHYIVVRSAPLCSPCSYVEHGIGLREGCAARTCMRMVTPEMVLDAANAVLEHRTGVQRAAPQHNDFVWPHRIQVLGLPVDAITYVQWLDLIGDWVESGERARQVCTTNPEFIMTARSDPNFRNILKRADLCVPDGVGLLWAARRKGHPLPERVTGSDGVPIIAERAAREGWRLFFLGAAPGVADQAADILRERYPGLQIIGTYSGSPSPEDEDAIVKCINASGADILFVAYGAPNQDKWIARNLPRLNVKMAMGVGGSFDFIAGVVPRAPEWMRRAGLEWLYRLYLQPWRIKRMLRLPRFVLAVLLDNRHKS